QEAQDDDDNDHPDVDHRAPLVGGETRPAGPSERQQDQGAESNPQEHGGGGAELGKELPGDRGTHLDRCDRPQSVQGRGDARRATGWRRVDAQIALSEATWARIFSISLSWTARWS